jgi:thiol:disulfide interchange protein
MRKAGLILALTVAAFLVSSYNANPIPQDDKEGALKWYTNLDEVHQLSKKTGKPIFGFFTGSDWCGWCHKLQREVFAKDAFVKWANEKVILLELDFPRKKQLPADLAKQNRELQAAFKVTGYPTIWIFNTDKDDEGRFNLTALGKLGYPRGAEPGKEEVKFISDADAVLANNQKKN